MPYTLEEFCTDTRNILKADPGRAGVDKVRANMQRLVKDEAFVSTYYNDSIPAGLL